MVHNKLVILDISSVVYPRTVLKAGADYWGGKTTVGREELHGLPIGGIKEVLSRSFVRLRDQIPVAWAFDSRNSRKEVSSEYKAARTFSADIAVQNEILKDIGRRLNIPCFYADGYEADEVIYQAVDANLDSYYNMDIITSDKGDMAGVIVKPGIMLIGADSKATTISRDNYEFAIRSGVPIKYNSVLPFNVFCGKPSNNLGVLHLPSGAKSRDYYWSYMQYCDAMQVKPEFMSKYVIFKAWLSEKYRAGEIPREDVEVILERATLCFPREIEGLDCTVPFYTYANLDKSEVLDVLRMFQMNDLARFLGITEIVNGDNATKADKAYLWRFKTVYSEGTFQADSGLSLRTEAFEGLDDYGVGDIE